MGRNPSFDVTGMHKNVIPSRLDFLGNKPILGIGGIILPEGRSAD